MNNLKPFWTKESVTKVALQYSERSSFCKSNPSAYNSAVKNGWLDETCSHMISTRKPAGYWTKELVKQEAYKYRTRNAFSKGSPGACHAARKNAWTDEVVAHMHKPNKPTSRTLKESRELLSHHTCNTSSDLIKPICPSCHKRTHSANTNIGGIKVGAGIKFFRSDIEDLDYLDRIGVLELMEDVSLGKAEADPMKAYEGVVTAINTDGTATVGLSNYDDNSMYEDGLGSVRDVDFEFLFVIS